MTFPTSPADQDVWPIATAGSQTTQLRKWDSALGAWRKFSAGVGAYSATTNLVDWLPASATQYSGTKGSGTDIGPYLIKALQWLRARYGRGTVYIPAGIWRMATAPAASVLSGMRIVGDGSQASTVIVDKTSGVAWYWSGATGFTGGGMRGIGTVLDYGLGATTCEAIVLQGDASFQPGQMFFEDCYITALNPQDTLDGGGKVLHPATSWYQGIKIYGNAKDTGAQGVRECTMRGMQVFACRSAGMYFSNAVGLLLDNCGTYVPGVTNPGTIGASPPTPSFSATGADIRIIGGGSFGPSSFTNSSGVSTANLQCNGTLYVYDCNAVATEGATADMWVAATAVNSRHEMKVTGTKTLSLGAGSVDRCY